MRIITFVNIIGPIVDRPIENDETIVIFVFFYFSHDILIFFKNFF